MGAADAHMKISILTFQGFNELDSFIAFGILNRVKTAGWQVNICCPAASVTSMNGLTVMAQSGLADVRDSDAVIVGSGLQTREVVQNPALIAQLHLDPSRQLIAAQCSGTLLLAKLGLLGKMPACTDLTTQPWVLEAGVAVLNQPFYAQGNIATAGGCFASQYVAAWLIAKTLGVSAAIEALHYVAPVGEKELFVERMLGNITPYIV
jgi:transcriptional regulator GlxA family with amidase domain